MRTFRDFMEAALYDPERGFYPRRTPTEDFYTAPELHPAFGGVLAAYLLRRLDSLKAAGAPGPLSVVEMGSGSGLLARQILKTLDGSRPGWGPGLRYVLVERDRGRLLESVRSLGGSDRRVLGYSRLEDLPACSGVFLSNELVDAFPLHLLEKRDGVVREVCVEESGREVLSDLSSPELEAHAYAVAESLHEGQRHAVNLEVLRWLKTAAEKLERGCLLTIDYGKRFHGEPNPPRTFRRHATDAAVTEAQGEKDITASVDFEALIQEGERLGLVLESYQTLSRFLIDGGIQDWLAKGEDAASLRSRAQVKTLIHPEGMGEVFKVLIQRKGPA